MPHYRTPDGTRHLTDEPPHEGWVLMTEAEVAEADAPKVAEPIVEITNPAREALRSIGLTDEQIDSLIESSRNL